MEAAGAFRAKLLSWYRNVRRDLPWRRTPTDPYRIWISEIMLQQTRVAAVIPYYERFLSRFPNPLSLASAPEQDVLAHWAGLGYYSRARNLQKAASQMPGGEFPRTYDEIRALSGIGDYTAAAVASIAYGLPYAAVDGNVLRVIARVENDPGDIKSPKTRARFAAIADELLDRDQPGDFNQAMMELGATVCTPKNPTCLLCPVREECKGFAAGTQNQLPIKIRDGRTAEVHITVVIAERDDGALLLRPSKQLAGFWELPFDLAGVRDLERVGSFGHQITFRKYTCDVVRGRVGRKVPVGTEWVARERLAELPLTTISKKALRLVDR
ncbi:hypothetical protein F183_A22370 [Bryobacterales bacterium F-183]|nr:hypothetical protein F183_A22370 [Bryobacterales bacterium F-183]